MSCEVLRETDKDVVRRYLKHLMKGPHDTTRVGSLLREKTHNGPRFESNVNTRRNYDGVEGSLNSLVIIVFCCFFFVDLSTTISKY